MIEYWDTLLSENRGYATHSLNVIKFLRDVCLFLGWSFEFHFLVIANQNLLHHIRMDSSYLIVNTDFINHLIFLFFA